MLESSQGRPRFDPNKFVPAVHAITLSKLALLDQEGVLAVGKSYDGDVGAIKMTQSRRYSPILDTVRSLDGSYQWQGYSMPMARRTGIAVRDRRQAAGYPVLQEPGTLTIAFDRKIKRRRGSPFYQTPNLREKVFASLFAEPFEGQILLREEFGALRYPFRPCSFDPFRATAGGAGNEPICQTNSD